MLQDLTGSPQPIAAGTGGGSRGTPARAGAAAPRR
jgi:hypothetical protein